MFDFFDFEPKIVTNFELCLIILSDEAQLVSRVFKRPAQTLAFSMTKTFIEKFSNTTRYF